MSQTAPIAFLDCETDGVHPGRKPWEIAIVRRDPDGIESKMHMFVEIDLSTADPFGLRVGRFYDRHPLGLAVNEPAALAFEEPAVSTRAQAARAVACFTHGAHIVGAVPNFDTERLDPLLREHGLLPAWHYHVIDVESLAIGYLAAQGKTIAPPWKSDELSTALGVEPASEQERHTAMGDVRWVMRTYDAIMTSQ